MEEPRIPSNEQKRLETLLHLNVLDTPSDDRYDRYTRICTRLFDTPIAVISLVDKYRQWFKSTSGLDAQETPRSISFCGHAILNNEVFEVQDALQDPRFRDNPLVTDLPNIRFYAGAPLTMPNNQNVGTLCIIDKTPRLMSANEKVMLKNLADMVVNDMVHFVDIETGLDNRNALIIAGGTALARSRPSQVFNLSLLDPRENINSLGSSAAKVAWREEFTKALRDQFGHAVSIAHLGQDRYCIMHEQMSALPEHDLLQHAFANANIDPHNNNVHLEDLTVRRSDFTSMEDILHVADHRFFHRGQTIAPARMQPYYLQ